MLGGTWTAQHRGVACDAFCARAAAQQAEQKLSLQQQELQNELDASAAQLEELDRRQEQQAAAVEEKAAGVHAKKEEYDAAVAALQARKDALGGYDADDGASLYFCDYMASLHKVPFGAHGYCSNFCLSIFDREWTALRNRAAGGRGSPQEGGAGRRRGGV